MPCWIEGVDESDDETLEEGVEDDDSDGVPVWDGEPDTDAVADTLLEKGCRLRLTR